MSDKAVSDKAVNCSIAPCGRVSYPLDTVNTRSSHWGVAKMVGGNGYGDIVDAAGVAMAAENRACAARHHAAYELYVECFRRWASAPDSRAGADFGRVDPWRVCCTHLVDAFRIGDRRAGGLLNRSIEFNVRLPSVLSAMAEGLLDERTASIIAEQTCTVGEDEIGAVQSRIVAEYLEALEQGQRFSAAGLRRAVDTVIAEIDPEGLARRTKKAVQQRDVRIRSAPDGMADLTAHLTSAEAAAIVEALRAHPAASSTGSDDVRATGERRADALCAMLLDENAATADMSRPRREESGAPRDAPAPTAATKAGTVMMPLRPRVTLIADAETGTMTPIFDRAGVGSIEALIALLARSGGVTVDTVDPAVGAADDSGSATRYRPTAEMDRRIRLRDGTCRHPGCSIRASLCDIDHLVPFQHGDPGAGGLTVESNLVCLCRAHHRLKTFTGWSYTLMPDGLLQITTDADHLLFTSPTGPLAHARYQREQKHTTDSGHDPPPF